MNIEYMNIEYMFRMRARNCHSYTFNTSSGYRLKAYSTSFITSPSLCTHDIGWAKPSRFRLASQRTVRTGGETTNPFNA